MPRLKINHLTRYRYPQPVSFGAHRLLLRPRDSHDIKLVSSRLSISPPAQMRWLHDVFGNSVAIANFEDASDELHIESEIVVDHYGVNDPDFPIEDYARTLPFSYPVNELPDLRATMARRSLDPDGAVDAWASRFLAAGQPSDTLSTLIAMTSTIKRDFTYVAREEAGVQEAADTLRLVSGSCRDFAMLMIEAARALGLAARFVTGYLYDPALDISANGDTGAGMVGAGSTHAWCQIYLPGMGWTEFDPTNGSYIGANLVRIGVAREPEQAKPVAGSYTGDAGGQSTMTVEVTATRET